MYNNEDFEDGINPHVMQQFLRLEPVDQARAASRSRARDWRGRGTCWESAK